MDQDKGDNMIMSYVVKMKNIRPNGLHRYINYLNNPNTKSHKEKNTVITELSNRDNFIKISSEKLWNNGEKYIKNGKGGRPLTRIGKSLTFNIPTQFEFNDNVSIHIYNEIINGLKSIYNSYGYNIDDSEIYSVLHKQDNSHFHIISPYLDREGNTLLFTNHYRFEKELKMLWNEIIINTYGISLEEYQPLKEREDNDNRRYLNELKEYYMNGFNLQEEEYIKNQVLKIDRLLRLSNEDLEEKKKQIKTLDNNLDKVLKQLNKKTNIQRIK